MKLKRLKSTKKAFRWKKGQSSLSNPSTNKFRKAAKDNFFEVIENSHLTAEAVAQHETDLRGVGPSGSGLPGTGAAVAATTAPSSRYTLWTTPGTGPAATITMGYNPGAANNRGSSAAAATSTTNGDAAASVADGGEDELNSEVAVKPRPNNLRDLEAEMDELSVDEFDDLKSQARTFATRFTTCSISAFESFFDKFSGESEHHVMMLSLHATVQDIIKEKQLPETPSSYFVAIIMACNGFLDSPEKLTAGLALLVRVIRSAPLLLLQAKCNDFGRVLNDILNKYDAGEHTKLLTHALGCLSILLRAQHLAGWYRNENLRTWLKNIFAFTLHNHPKIRKSAQYNTSAVLKGSMFMISSSLHKTDDDVDDDYVSTKDKPTTDDAKDDVEEGSDGAKPTVANGSSSDVGSAVNGTGEGGAEEVHPAAGLVADLLIFQLETAGSANTKVATKTTLHTLVFARQIISSMPAKRMPAVVRGLLRLVSVTGALVNRGVMQALVSLYAAHPPSSILRPKTATHLLTTLTTPSPNVSSAVVPASHNATAVADWAAVITVAIHYCLRCDVAEGISWAGRWCELALQYWRGNVAAVVSTMEESVSAVLGSVYDSLTTINAAEHQAGILTIMKHMEEGLSYQYHGAWSCVFRLIGQCYNEFGLYYVPMMMPTLKILTEVMANNQLSSLTELERVIGKAVQTLGVEAVVQTAPVIVTGNIAKDEKNLWLLPLLRKYVRHSRLKIFIDYFIPLSENCFRVNGLLSSNKDAHPRLVATYKTIEYQIWGLLPSFAKDAIDVNVAQGDKRFAKLICDLLQHSESSRLDAMLGLRNMIAADGTKTGKLAANSRNYIIALFKLFMKESRTVKNIGDLNAIPNTHRLDAFQTIKAYLPIVPEKKLQELIVMVLERYEEETKKRERQLLLQLLRAFVPYANAEHLAKIYDIVVPIVKSAKDRRQQKAAYRVVEEVLGAGTIGDPDGEAEDDNDDATEQRQTTSMAAVEFVNENLDKLTELLLNSTAVAAVTSRAPRLRCAKVVLERLTHEADEDVCEKFLQRTVAEAVMCCGHANSVATRKAAFLLLASLSPAMKRIRQCDDDMMVRHCMQLLMGGLLGRATLCANTIIAIAAYTYQCKEILPLDLLEQNVSNIALLLKSSVREIVQACLSFIKAVVALYPVAVLSPLCKTIMMGIVNMTGDCARRYRMKTKAVLARLMRKCGDDYVCKLVPSSNLILQRRLRNLRKEASRARRQRASENEKEEQREQTRRTNPNSGGSAFTDKTPTSLDEILAAIDPDLAGDDDDGDDDDHKRGRRGTVRRRLGKKKTSEAWMEEEDEDDDVLDLLGPDVAQAVMTKLPTKSAVGKKGGRGKDGAGDEDTGGFAVDKMSGKLIITDKGKQVHKTTSQLGIGDLEEILRMKTGAQSGKITDAKKRKRAAFDSDDDDDIDMPVPKRSPRVSRSEAQKKKFDYGAEFRSKKGHGDVMRRGQTQKPYAYVPISKDRLNKRKKAKFDGQFKWVVKGSRRGALKGAKARKSGKKSRV